MNILLTWLMLTAVVVPAVSCAAAPAGEITVFAAAGAKPALDEICQRFQEEHGITVEITYGGGGEVLSQMELSRSGDVYVAPEQGFMEKAAAKGLIDPDTVTAVAGMVPVIGVPADNPCNIRALEDLASPGVRVAVTRPETTLLGRYAPEIFEKAGLAGEIGANVVTEAARPDSLLTMLVMGQVDAGIIWNFYEVQAADDILVIYLSPEQLTGIGEMQAAVTDYTENGDAARQFVDFLASAEGREVFGNLGYLVGEEQMAKYRR